MLRHSEQVRLLTPSDHKLIAHLLNTSEYTYQRFTLDELAYVLRTYPAVGVFHGSTLKSFLITQTVNPPTAWIGGYGVSWTESRAYLRYFDLQMEKLTALLRLRGVRQLYYSGNDQENDWLRIALLERGFTPYHLLYAYDKYDFNIPNRGNQQVTIRRAAESDLPVLLNIEQLCFEHLWRYEAASFLDILHTHPYFVVAELDGQVVGYQFNIVDSDYGYLVRIAVRPDLNSRGIGTRLMAEAIRYFQSVRVTRILLNTQQENTHAHRLYEYFGFVKVDQLGFVLRKNL
jgi:ribosomal protein S18 acetylase RimI-like enzyme